MALDKDLKDAFEVADDGLQGILGYSHYVMTCYDSASKIEIIKRLPSKYLRITHNWDREYKPDELCKEMQKVFPEYLSRTALISVVGMFDAALFNFIEILRKRNCDLPKISNNYKGRLKWAFDEIYNSKDDTEAIDERIPYNCLNIDHARRIRDLWTHHNGLFHIKYEKSFIPVKGKTKIVVPEYYEFKKSGEPIAISILPEMFEKMCFSHIELLHLLYNHIQKKYFGYAEPYDYVKEGKGIEWHRCLVGF